MTCIYADSTMICLRAATILAYCDEHAPKDPLALRDIGGAMEAVSGEAFTIAAWDSAFQRLAELVAPPRCEHGVLIAFDCNACEPILDGGDGFDEDRADELRRAS